MVFNSVVLLFFIINETEAIFKNMSIRNIIYSKYLVIIELFELHGFGDMLEGHIVR